MSRGDRARTTLTPGTRWRRAASPQEQPPAPAYRPRIMFPLMEKEEPRKETYSPYHLPHPHSMDPHVLVFILPVFKPSLGRGGHQ